MPSFADLLQSSRTGQNPDDVAMGRIQQGAQSGGFLGRGFQQILDQINQRKSTESLTGQIQGRIGDVTDPNSPLYRQFQAGLSKQLSSAITPSSLLALARGRGLSQGSASAVSNEQLRAAQSRVGDIAGQATSQFFQQNQGQAQGLLGMLLQNDQFRAQLAQQQSQFQESQPTFGEQLLNIGSFGLGQVLGG